MIELIMYFGIGFFAAGLTVLAVVPAVHGRAVRLTMRRLEAALPASMAEVAVEKDLLRADLPKILGERFRIAYPIVEFLGSA